MAMLLGVLLALQRLSGESEITALKAGGISLARASSRRCSRSASAFRCSTLFLQEGVVPYANDRANYLREKTIEHVGIFGGGDLTVNSKLPDGGRQSPSSRLRRRDATLCHVTLIQYDARNRPVLIVFSDRAATRCRPGRCKNATEYHFEPDGTTWTETAPTQQWDIGQNPSQIMTARREQ